MPKYYENLRAEVCFVNIAISGKASLRIRNDYCGKLSNKEHKYSPRVMVHVETSLKLQITFSGNTTVESRFPDVCWTLTIRARTSAGLYIVNFCLRYFPEKDASS